MSDNTRAALSSFYSPFTDPPSYTIPSLRKIVTEGYSWISNLPPIQSDSLYKQADTAPSGDSCSGK